LFNCEPDRENQVRALLALYGIREPVSVAAGPSSRKKARRQLQTVGVFRFSPSSCGYLDNTDDDAHVEVKDEKNTADQNVDEIHV